ncbi:MAG: O-antigen ligase family protein [Nitrospirales bacterium]
MRAQQNTVESSTSGIGAKNFLKAPPIILEYAYYALVFNGIFGLVSIPFLGIGGYLIIAVLCVMHFGKFALFVYRPIALALGCAFFAVLLNFVLHEEGIGQEQMREYITWAVCLIVVQSLAMRKGFLQRFAIFAFLVGLDAFLSLRLSGDPTELVRAGSEDLGSANAVAMWYGFCFIYFLISGLEAKNNFVRGSSWAGGLFCFMLMGMTVSRGPLLGAAIAGALAFKRVLKRSFLPVIGFLIISWFVYIAGLLDNIIGYYIERGTVETGRIYLWERGFAQFLDSWWGGVGFSNAKITKYGGTEGGSGPHNSLINIGFSSGVIPLVLYMSYLWETARRAFQLRKERSGYAPFLLPMFSFAMLEMMILDWTFMNPWVMVVFATILSEQNYLRFRSNRGESNLS